MNHVFIKPLGVLVESSLIGPTVRFEMQKVSEFELITEGADTNVSLAVREVVRVTANAVVTLHGDVNALDGGAEAFNEATETRAEQEIEEELASVKAAIPPVVKRGRKPKAVVEPEEDEGEDEDAKFDRLFDQRMSASFRAYTFPVEEIVAKSPEEIPFRSCAAYVAVCSMNPKWKDPIDEKLGQLRKYVGMRAEAATTLQGSGEIPGSALDSVMVSSLVGDDLEDDSVRLIDQQALGNQRQTMRERLDQIEDRIRANYQWLDKNVIQKYNSMHKSVSVPFEDLQLGDHQIKTAEVISSFYEEVFVRV